MFGVRGWMLNVAALAATTSALAGVHCVDMNSTNAAPPYTNWTTAATNIQDAVDAAVAGDEIVVTDGTYATGGRDGNRVEVYRPLTLRSVNGPQFTTIDGGGYFRCVYLGDSASLSGFTLTNGFGYFFGGGVWCQWTNAVVSNCVVSGNSAYTSVDRFNEFLSSAQGGGAYGGTLINCTLSGNSVAAYNSSSDQPSLTPYAQGGGAYGCALINCTLRSNSASAYAYVLTLQQDAYAQGGGAESCTLNNCTLSGNWVRAEHRPGFGNGPVHEFGHGAYWCTLNNCTLTGNSPPIDPIDRVDLGSCDGGRGRGAQECNLRNCIVYFNGTAVYDNYDYCSALNYCCTPLPASGVGNITNAPLFVDTNGWSNLRLQSNSPCISAGLNSFAPAGPDLDGNPRIVGGSVDIGAYEYQSLDVIGFGVVSNQFGFNVTGQSNWVIILEASSDFANWIPLTTNTLSGSPFSFRDPTPPNLPQRFYRARME